MTKLFLALLLAANVMAAEHIMKTPDELKWSEAPKSLPVGAKAALIEGDPSKKGPFTLRLRMPANYRIMPHWHPGIEHVTVLEGTFFMGEGDRLDESKAHALPAGGIAVMPVKFHHFAYTNGEGATIQLHGMGPWDIVYINQEDDPRKKLGK